MEGVPNIRGNCFDEVDNGINKIEQTPVQKNYNEITGKVSSQAGESVELGNKNIEELAEDMGNIISELDHVKINNWEYTPKDELYLKYKDIDESVVFKRYGEPSGEFLGNNATDRALAPHSQGANEYYYRPTEKFDITSANAAPWFGSDGGAKQFVKYKIDGTRYSIQELLDEDLIEDITDLVKRGDVTID